MKIVFFKHNENHMGKEGKTQKHNLIQMNCRRRKIVFACKFLHEICIREPVLEVSTLITLNIYLFWFSIPRLGDKACIIQQKPNLSSNGPHYSLVNKYKTIKSKRASTNLNPKLLFWSFACRNNYNNKKKFPNPQITRDFRSKKNSGEFFSHIKIPNSKQRQHVLDCQHFTLINHKINLIYFYSKCFQ